MSKSLDSRIIRPNQWHVNLVFSSGRPLALSGHHDQAVHPCLIISETSGVGHWCFGKPERANSSGTRDMNMWFKICLGGMI